MDSGYRKFSYIPEPKRSFKIKESGHSKTFHHKLGQNIKWKYNIWLIKISNKEQLRSYWTKYQEDTEKRQPHSISWVSVLWWCLLLRVVVGNVNVNVRVPLWLKLPVKKAGGKIKQHRYKSGTKTYDSTHWKYQIKTWLRMKVTFSFSFKFHN